MSADAAVFPACRPAANLSCWCLCLVISVDLWEEENTSHQTCWVCCSEQGPSWGSLSRLRPQPPLSPASVSASLGRAVSVCLAARRPRRVTGCPPSLPAAAPPARVALGRRGAPGHACGAGRLGPGHETSFSVDGEVFSLAPRADPLWCWVRRALWFYCRSFCALPEPGPGALT